MANITKNQGKRQIMQINNAAIHLSRAGHAVLSVAVTSHVPPSRAVMFATSELGEIGKLVRVV